MTVEPSPPLGPNPHGVGAAHRWDLNEALTLAGELATDARSQAVADVLCHLVAESAAQAAVPDQTAWLAGRIERLATLIHRMQDRVGAIETRQREIDERLAELRALPPTH